MNNVSFPLKTKMKSTVMDDLHKALVSLGR
jgi:hypothetical protein